MSRLFKAILGKPVSPFIKFTEDVAGSKREKFVSVIYIAAADFDVESGELTLTVNEGGFKKYVLHGREATAALAAIRNRMAQNYSTSN